MKELLKRRVLVGVVSIIVLLSIFSPFSPLENYTEKIAAVLLIVIGSGIGILTGKYPKLTKFIFPLFYLWPIADIMARFFFKKDIGIFKITFQDVYYFASFGWGFWFCRNLYLSYARRRN